MRFGFHVSMAGGFSKVLERAREVQCETMQMFSSNPRGWAVAELDAEDVARFRADMKNSEISPIFVHAPYLPNVAAAGASGKRSVKALVKQAERCAALGVGFLILHMGKALGAKEATAISRTVKNVDAVLAGTPESVMLLFENTAGMGSEVGYRFEQVAAVIAGVKQRDRVGVVLDTAHAFAAGYEFRTKAGLDATLREFDRLVGLSRLHLLHLNDSKSDFGSRVDRHWHIGEGKIGKEGIGEIVHHPLLRNLPAVMETPRDSAADDLRNLKAVRALVQTGGVRRQKSPSPQPSPPGGEGERSEGEEVGFQKSKGMRPKNTGQASSAGRAGVS
ncbi:deoxyribonuclease IV [candidate division WOR-3 bacterium]|nr:deoxyribonuclease IV [candidate division WOR-3 bacterium]